MQLPEKFVERVKRDLGEAEGAALCAALDTEPPTSVRYNPFKLSEKPTGEYLPWSRYGAYLAQRPQFTLDPKFQAGTYYVQEASSQFVGHILATTNVEGAKVLDLCAAPGGKTTLYSTLVGLDGLVVANEVNRQRASVLADNVRRWGVGNVVVTNNDPSHVAQAEAWFDVVAVDAPCSGEGMFRKSDEARAEWSEANVAMCAVRQQEILREAWRALRPGGLLIYSTCTFNVAEDEDILREFESWTDGEVVESEDVVCGDDWGVVTGRVGPFQTFHFYPHRAKGEGFFASVARKAHDVGGRIGRLKARKSVFANLDRGSLTEVRRWVQQPDFMHFALVADTVYGYYESQFDNIKILAEGLNVIYSGVAMGQIFKGCLKPDHALALFHALDTGALPTAELNEEEAVAYLKKRDLAVEKFEQGVNVVMFDSYPIGFAKRIGARVNNMYPNQLRILMD